MRRGLWFGLAIKKLRLGQVVNTHVRLCRQAVFDADQGAMMPYDWDGDHGYGVALVISHRQWYTALTAYERRAMGTRAVHRRSWVSLLLINSAYTRIIIIRKDGN